MVKPLLIFISFSFISLKSFAEITFKNNSFENYDEVFLQGLELFEDQNFFEAQDYFFHLVQKDPENSYAARAYFYYAMTFYFTNQYKKSSTAFDFYFDNYGSNPENFTPEYLYYYAKTSFKISDEYILCPLVDTMVKSYPNHPLTKKMTKKDRSFGCLDSNNNDTLTQSNITKQLLKDLRNEKVTIEKKKYDDYVPEKNSNNLSLTVAEIEILREQLSSCWSPPAGAVIERGMKVTISAKISQSRKVLPQTIRLVDTNISKTNSYYSPIIESAKRLLVNPECSSLNLPKEKYNLWKQLTLTLDYSILNN